MRYDLTYVQFCHTILSLQDAKLASQILFSDAASLGVCAGSI